MKKESLLWKQSTIFVILLFCGLAFAPSIHANISKESELVEITTEVCGLPGLKPQTIQLTQEQADEVDRLFDEIKIKLDAVESREETVEIFNEAIVELDNYGLLGACSVKQIQILITGRYKNLRELPFLEKKSTKVQATVEDIDNALCLIVGQTTNTFFQIWLSAAILMSSIPLQLLYFVFFILLQFNLFPIISTIILFFLANLGSLLGRLIDVTLFQKPLLFGVNMWLSESNGWIHTIGLKGIQKIEGYLNGRFPVQGIIDEYFKAWIYGYSDPFEPIKAAKRFTGLRINIDNESYESFFIGTALTVQLGL